MIVSRNDYSEFREELFKLHLNDKGFSFDSDGPHSTAITNNNLKIILLKDYTNVLDEIFVRKIYGENYFVGKIVIDIGASIGDTALYFISYGAKKVYGFEIDKERYELAVRNVKLNNMDNRIFILNDEATSKSISELIVQENLDDLILKIDCEGCEYDLIKNLSDNIFNKIRFITMEFHSSPKPLISKLKKVGYKVKKDKRILIPEGFIFAERKK
jgi:predicted RNA methylase